MPHYIPHTMLQQNASHTLRTPHLVQLQIRFIVRRHEHGKQRARLWANERKMTNSCFQRQPMSLTCAAASGLSPKNAREQNDDTCSSARLKSQLEPAFMKSMVLSLPLTFDAASAAT